MDCVRETWQQPSYAPGSNTGKRQLTFLVMFLTPRVTFAYHHSASRRDSSVGIGCHSGDPSLSGSVVGFLKIEGSTTMRLKLGSIIVLICLTAIVSTAFAQSDSNLRAEVEKISSAHAENFNKQNAAGIAALYAQGAKLVNAAGVQTSVEENFQNAFKLGFNHQEVTIGEVSSIAPDVALGIGEYANKGQGQNGALEVRGAGPLYTPEKMAC
jgi:ketosteroid isomerase-like protein